MKVLKRLIISMMLVCLCLGFAPSITAKALDGSVVYSAITRAGDAAGREVINSGGIITGWRVQLVVRIWWTDGTSSTDYVGGFITETDLERVASKYTNELLTNLNRLAGTEVGGVMPSRIEVDHVGFVLPVTKSRSEGTRHYGYDVYAGTVTVNKSGANTVTIADVTNAFTSGSGVSYKRYGAANYGGKNDEMPLRNPGPASESEALTMANTILSYSSTDTAQFISTFGVMSPINGYSKESIEASIANASSTVTLPLHV